MAKQSQQIRLFIVSDSFIKTAEMDAVIWRWEIVREEPAKHLFRRRPSTKPSKLAISKEGADV